MFSDAGPDVRWCGNENGTAGDPNWSTVNPDVVTFPGADGPGITDSLQHGDRAGTGTTIFTATSSRSCSPDTAQSQKCGSMAPTERAQMGNVRSMIGPVSLV